MHAPANRWVVLVLVCFAQFMVVLDATVVNVALPSIQKDLGLSEANLQWIINAYTLVFGGFLLLDGRAGDLLGRKRLFLAGIVVFTVASLQNGLSTSCTASTGHSPARPCSCSVRWSCWWHCCGHRTWPRSRRVRRSRSP